MDVVISGLTPSDGDAVDRLMKRNSRTLGFLPRKALDDYLEKGTVLGAKSDTGVLVGYLLYAANPFRFRVVHLCVSDDFRNQKVARRLVDELKKTATTQKDIGLHCRRDYLAHHMWPALGFVPLNEKPARSGTGHTLTLWYLDLAPGERLGLFRANTSDETVDVVVDSQILFDFHEPENDKTKPSKSLLSDFLAGAIHIFLTDEIYLEIDRSKDPKRREVSRQYAGGFPKIDHDAKSAEHFTHVLGGLLPGSTPSRRSDIRHLAKTAASTVRVFVTRDEQLLKESASISNLTGLHVLSPTDLIIRHHELLERQSYVPDRVAGVGLAWRRWSHEDSARFPFDSFLNYRERKGNFKSILSAFLADPGRFRVEILHSGDDTIAVRVLALDGGEKLVAPMVRIARAVDQRQFGRFVVADILARAVEEDLEIVQLGPGSMTPGLGHDLLEMGFTKRGDDFVRFCFSRCLNHEETLERIGELSPGATETYRNLTHLDLEGCCSPLGMEAADQKYFVVPVRPHFAMSLVDRRRSADDLFGGKAEVLLRWDNVYYRSRTHHRILRPPARILWYVSGKEKSIVAVSRLDETMIDNPKILFRKFKRFGILEWRDLCGICDGDPTREIMALVFSHTFSFREPVSLGTMRSIFSEDGRGLTLQSPLSISGETFRRIFEQGFSRQS